MKKTEDEYFRDWFHEPFGFGYGTGERPILISLKRMTDHLEYRENQCIYNYEVLEKWLGEEQTWFMINALCKNNDIDYGTSPRYGWFYGCRAKLINYIKSHEVDHMYETVSGYDQDYRMCFDDYCDCYQSGQRKGRCQFNPFWNDKPKELVDAI